jgi:glycyl-tRNA synthetase
MQTRPQAPPSRLHHPRAPRIFAALFANPMSQTKEIPLMEKIVSLCKRRGFIFQSSEIYGGINGFWDYGPLGAELKRNLRDTWWKAMMRDREDVVPLDASIIMHPAIWKASGHVDTFADPMSTCKSCKKLVRSDQWEAMMAESAWVQSLAGVADVATQNFDGPALLRWAEKKGKQYAPNLALVRNPQVTLSWLAERSKNSATHPVSAMEFYQYVATEQLAATGLVTPCPHCGGELTAPRPFNLMLRTHTGPVESDENIAYLRPETAQAIFAQFKNVADSTRVKVPFGIGQIGKAFRNEITPRNFTFRSREFEQMELEFFIKPDEAIEAVCGSVAQWSEGADLSAPQANWGWEMWHRYWVAQRTAYYAGIGLSKDAKGEDVLDYFWQGKADLAHYARACVDILFKFPFGTEELEGIAARGDFDLTAHQNACGKPLEVFDEEVKLAFAKWTPEQRAALTARKQAENSAKEKGVLPAEKITEWCERLFKGFYVPHVIEPSAGLDRLALAVLTLAYTEMEKTDAKGNKETQIVMRFHPRIAPKKVAVFPLLKNKPELVAKARAIYDTLKKHVAADYDEGGSIGKRYARQDEAGTPFCVTVDFDTLGEKGPELLDTVTLRHRDDGSQERVKIGDLPGRLLPLVS